MKLIHPSPVTRGVDPRVHLLRMRMDCRVKPGNDVDECQRDTLQSKHARPPQCAIRQQTGL